jgi:type VI secretion system ImpC/EvpB family protein/type VI secretion system ImpB/VipA family protein
MTDEPLPPDLDVQFSSPDGLKVTAQRPYRLLYLADFGGSAAGRVAGPLADGPVEVDAESFDAILSTACPTVAFKTVDPTATGSALVEIELPFSSLKAFAPKAILAHVAPARPLVEAREQIVARMRGKLSAAQLEAAIARLAGTANLNWLVEALRWTPAAAAQPENVVDDVLAQLDLGDGSTPADVPPPKTPLGKVVAAVAAGGGTQLPAEEASTLRRALAEIDRRATAWLNTVLHAPAVQRLEAVWRSLAFLVAHCEFRKGLRLAVLHAPRAATTERLVAGIIDPVFDAGADAPDLILVDPVFSNQAADIELLDELAQHGASLPAVVLAAVGPEFLGVKHAWQVPTLPAFVNLFDQWQFAKWKTLRGQPYARSLGVLFGRGLLRAPYAETPADTLDFAYREECVADADFVWASGPVVAACTIAKSFADTQWPTGIVGRLEGLSIAQGGKKGDKQFGPADTQMPLEKAQELTAGGLNAVIGLRNQTDVIVCNGFTAARAGRAEGLALLEVSLPYQLFAGRLSSLLLDLKPHLSGLGRDQLVAFVLTHVRDWLTTEDTQPDEQQVAVQARPPEDGSPGLQLAVTVTPPPRILPGAVPVVVGYRVS